MPALPVPRPRPAAIKATIPASLVRIHLQRVVSRHANLNLHPDLAPDALQFTADQAYAPIHGAHPHQHAIRKRLLDPLSLEILDGRFSDGDHISAQLKDAKVTFSKYLTEISKLQEKGGTISWTFGK